MTVIINFTVKCDICGHEYSWQDDDTCYLGEEIYSWEPEGWGVIWPENHNDKVIEACPACYRKHEEAA